MYLAEGINLSPTTQNTIMTMQFRMYRFTKPDVCALLFYLVFLSVWAHGSTGGQASSSGWDRGLEKATPATRDDRPARLSC